MGMTVDAFTQAITQAIQFSKQAAEIPGIERLGKQEDTPGLGM